MIDRRQLLLGTAAIAGAAVAGAGVATAPEAVALPRAMVVLLPNGMRISGGHIFASLIDPITGEKGEFVNLGVGTLSHTVEFVERSA